MRGKGFVLAAIVLMGCAGTQDSSSCSETPYSGGSLVDCGSNVTFLPQRGDLGNARSPLLGSIELPASLLSIFPADVAAQTPYTNCQRTQVPEGTWTVCDGGFSQLKRNDTAIAAYQRRVDAAKASVTRTAAELQKTR